MSDDQATEAAITSSIKTWIRVAPAVVAGVGLLLSLGMCPKLDTFQTKPEAASALALLQTQITAQAEAQKAARAESREDYQRLDAKLDRVLELLAKRH